MGGGEECCCFSWSSSVKYIPSFSSKEDECLLNGLSGDRIFSEVAGLKSSLTSAGPILLYLSILLRRFTVERGWSQASFLQLGDGGERWV